VARAICSSGAIDRLLIARQGGLAGDDLLLGAGRPLLVLYEVVCRRSFCSRAMLCSRVRHNNKTDDDDRQT